MSQGYYFTSLVGDHNAVANVHFGIPHKHDGGRDDVQLLMGQQLHLHAVLQLAERHRTGELRDASKRL